MVLAESDQLNLGITFVTSADIGDHAISLETQNTRQRTDRYFWRITCWSMAVNRGQLANNHTDYGRSIDKKSDFIYSVFGSYYSDEIYTYQILLVEIYRYRC